MDVSDPQLEAGLALMSGRRARQLEAIPSYARRRGLSIAVFVVALVVLVPVLVKGPSNLGLMTLWMLYSIAALSFYFVFSLSGQFAFCVTFMASLGAFTSAWASESQPFLVSVLFGLFVTGTVALVFAVLVRRSNHLYFAIATLGLSEIGVIVFSRWQGLGGIDGTRIGVPKPELFGFRFDTTILGFWLALGALVIVLSITALIERSPARREIIAFRDSPVVASTLGVPVMRYQIAAFVLASVFAALMGALYAHIQGFASVEAFGLDLAIGVFVMVLLGGTGSLWGPVIGAAFYVFVPDALEAFSAYENIIFGTVLIVTMIAFPEGIVGIGLRLRRMVLQLLRRHPDSKESPPSVNPGDDGAGQLENRSGQNA